ncbi:unnamed protein product [Peronospora belbahrii]|uniref:Cytochrome b5 heme-binding domain-containing protein n=1 Tax=Peronospora belbahrii TaxID=622444 RepID=A0AAU9KX14_9STRA|nr:unnamed protein product [Peronospora belbahrii]CAH0513338.1 unnamed protein product [Peronospora belbahrii]
MASSPVQKHFSLASGSSSSKSNAVIAQYIVSKIAWWATYPRLLLVTSSTLSTYNPETFQCTDQWEIGDIATVEVLETKDQFILRLEKSRFRSTKLKLACSARGHLLSLLARLRRQVQGKALVYRLVGARRLHYRCIEQFADASTKLLFLQVTVASLIFLDQSGRPVQILPFLYLRNVALATEHSDGMVLSTAFHDRFFLCSERRECLLEIVAAANEAGLDLHETSSEITALHLRLHHMQILDRPSLFRFDVKKVKNQDSNGHVLLESNDRVAVNKEIQLILQAHEMVEMHSSMCTVIARPYNALLAIVRPDWNSRTLVLEFKQEDTLILDVDGRNELVTILLLVCHEAGHHNVILTPSGLNYCRFYHPHAADTTTSNAVGAWMETFLLRRIAQTSVGPEENSGGRSRGSSVWSPRRRRGGSVTFRATLGNNDLRESDSNGRGSWFQRRINKDKCTAESLYETRNSMDSGVSMNDNVSIVIAMEELNANLLLDELTRSKPKRVRVVNKAMKLVFEHLVTLVASLRRYGDTTSSELITTLQALVRLYYHPDAYFTDKLIPHVLDAVHELILQQDILTCYWCLRLLQCFLGVRTPNTSSASNSAERDQRAKMIQHFVHHKTLQHAVIDLIPASYTASVSSSFVTSSSAIGVTLWMADLDVGSSASSSRSSAQFSTLRTKEARVQNEISVVFYETLLTLHHLLIHMQGAAKLQRTARDRQNYVAAGKRKKLQIRGFDDLPVEKQMDALGGKLLEKHRFLMDSVLDARLVRMAETSIALVKFVLSHFATKPPDSPLQPSPSDNQLLNSRAGNFQDSRKKWLGALGLFLDDYVANTAERPETQSLQLGSKRTIEMPDQGFSYGTSEPTDVAIEKLARFSTTNCIGAITSNGSMRLEYLNPSEPPSSTRGEKIDKNTSQLGPRKTAPELEKSRQNSKHSQKRKTCENVATGHSQRQHHTGDTSPAHPIYDSIGTDIFGSDDGDDTVGPMLRSDHAPTAAQAIQRSFQAPIRLRRTAGTCDACIGCNDVCANERCFVCAEKEYQLKVAFGDSSEATGPTVRQAAWQHCAPSSTDSSFHVDREYSSCEIKRHQSMRSCWIRVGDSIYDVTDLLGVHPGGAQVLLQAAQHGGNCDPILNTHPPAARKMLTQHRLGRYYECTNS